MLNNFTEKKTFYLILIVSILLSFTFSCKLKKESEKLKKASHFKKILQLEDKKLSFNVETNESPEFPAKEVILNFSKHLKPVESLTEIYTTPQVKKTLKWEDDKTLKIKLSSVPKNIKKLKFTIKKLPGGLEKDLSNKSFSIQFPSFKLINIFAYSTTSNSFILKLAFNYPVFAEEIKSKLKIFKNNNEIPFSVYGNQTNFAFTLRVFTSPEGIIKVFIPDNFKSVNNYTIGKNIEKTIKVKRFQRTLHIEYLKTRETKDGFMFIFRATSQVEQPIVKKESLKNRVFVFPQVKYRVFTSNNKIYIKGNFLQKTKYSVLFLPGIEDEKGAIIEKELLYSVKTGTKKGKVFFLYRGKYFGKKGGIKLPIQTKKIRSLTVKAFYMPERNITFWESEKERWYDDVDFLKKYSEKVAEKKFNIEKDGINFLNLREIINVLKDGMYLIEASGRTENGRLYRDSIKIVITDLSIVSKWTKNEINIWVVNSNTLKPVSDAQVKVLTDKNFLFGTCKTNSSGFCKINCKDKERSPYTVFAKKGSDWTYMEVYNSKIDLTAYDTSGKIKHKNENYIFAIFFERDLIRPSDTINFSVIARKSGILEGISIPIRVKIRNPKGKIEKVLFKKTDSYGIADFSFKTFPYSPTGKYSVEVYVGKKQYYTGFFFLKAFAPERLLVSISLKKEISDNILPLSISAYYLFGEPAAGETFKGKISAEEFSPQCSGYLGYKFGKLNKNQKWTFNIKKTKLDSSGSGDVYLELKNFYPIKPVRFSVSVDVSEGGGGRASKKTKVFTFYKHKFYIGLKGETKSFTANKPFTIKGVLLKEGCKLYKKTVKLYYDIYEVDYFYSYYYGSRFSWERNRDKLPLFTGKTVVAKDGKFKITFIPEEQYKDYLIVVKTEDETLLSEYYIESWFRGEERPESPQVLQIKTEKNSAFEGEPFKAKVLLPFEGKILWSVELDKVFYKELKDAKGKESSFKFKVPENVSTIYITALLIKKANSYMLKRAFGVKKIKVVKKDFEIPLKIDVKSKTKPNTTLKIKLKGDGKYKAIISIVDEGILNITNYKVLDFYKVFFPEIALSVTTSDTFGWIIKKYLSGGGDFEETFALTRKFMEKRVEGFTQPKFFKTVSIWSGVLESDKRGNIEYSFKVPEYQGRLKVMVIAISKNRVKSIEKKITVKRDVAVIPTIPRFAYSGDTFEFPITLINTTSLKKRVIVEVKGDLTDNFKKEAKLLPKEKVSVWVKGEAEKFKSSALIEIKVKSDNEIYKNSFRIPVYPRFPYIVQSKTFSIKGNESLNFKNLFDSWLSEGFYLKLLISPFRGASILRHIDFAVNYPYGCIEQTATKTLLYAKLKNLIKFLKPELSNEEIISRVNSGIARIISMQKIQGGFSFWPESNYINDWATAYALFTLKIAQEEGYYVPSSSINSAVNYILHIPDISPFSLYVLTQSLEKPSSIRDKVLEYRPKTFRDYIWLTLSLKNLGYFDKAKRYLEFAFKKEAENSFSNFENFFSPIKGKALLLYASLEILNDKNVHNRLLDLLTSELSSYESFYYTTQELSWSILALSKYIKKYGMGDIRNIKILENGKPLTKKQKNGIISYTIENKIKANSITIFNNGNSPLSITTIISGYNSENKEFYKVSNGLDLNSYITDSSGKQISIAKLGSIGYFYLWINSTGFYTNCAIEIPIPAGFEIETPEKDFNKNYNEKGSISPDFIDIKDDRIIVFTSLKKGLQYFKFKIRAVTPGVFHLPQTKAFLMYNPRVEGKTSSGTFVIERK